jgi:succinate dehydrogenase / fumarate reductase, iron-sulfur subunit
MYISGRPHGPQHKTTTCELRMREFKDGDTITVEPWRAASFPVIKDLIVDRTAFDKIQQVGGFISVNAGAAQDANSILVPKKNADEAFDSASCLGCGACVAACKNSSAMLFIAAKVTHLAQFPQGRMEAEIRVKNMVAKMDELGFGSCTNTRACEAECPKGISISNIAKLNREFLVANLKE